MSAVGGSASGGKSWDVEVVVMKKIILPVVVAVLIFASGCSTVEKYNTEENKEKIKELIEKYNTPENRDKLADAIEKLMKSQNKD